MFAFNVAIPITFNNSPTPITFNSLTKKCLNKPVLNPISPTTPQCTLTSSPPPSRPPPPTPDPQKTTSFPKRIPIHWRIPFVGVFFETQVLKIRAETLAKRYGPIYRTDFVGRSALVISDMSTIRQLSQSDDTFIMNGAWAEPVLKALGVNMLANLDGAIHAQKRRALNPIFTSAAIARILAITKASASKMWSSATTAIERDGNVVMAPFVRRHFLNVVVEKTTGLYGRGMSEQEMQRLQKLYTDLIAGFLYPELFPQGRAAVHARSELLEILQEVIRVRVNESADLIQHIQNSADENNYEKIFEAARPQISSGKIDLLTVMCAMYGINTEDSTENKDENNRIIYELAEQILFIWFAGMTTSPGPTLVGLVELGKDRDLVERIRKEQANIPESELIQSVMRGQKSLPLLASFVEETLRFQPPVPAYVRMCAKDTELLGYPVKKGQLVMADVQSSQRNDKYYPDAASFRADRFVANDAEPILSFGAPGSAHQCIGSVLARSSIMLTFLYLIRHYDFRLRNDGQDEEILALPEVVPKSGVELVKLTPLQRPK